MEKGEHCSNVGVARSDVTVDNKFFGQTRPPENTLSTSSGDAIVV